MKLTFAIALQMENLSPKERWAVYICRRISQRPDLLQYDDFEITPFFKTDPTNQELDVIFQMLMDCDYDLLYQDSTLCQCGAGHVVMDAWQKIQDLRAPEARLPCVTFGRHTGCRYDDRGACVWDVCGESWEIDSSGRLV